MDKVKSNTEKLIQGIHSVTGIGLSAIKAYSENNNIFDIIDHPFAIEASDKQYEKLKMLKDFINVYSNSIC